MTFTIYEQICSEQQRLEQKLTSIQDKIRQLPEGKLICSRSGNYTKWFKSGGHHSTYIPKKNRKLAEQLAIRKYLSLLEKDLHQEQKAIDFYLRHHSSTSYAEQLIHKTGLGIYVRSKSEAIIAMLLHTHKIPFRYECALEIGDTVIYPDFTLRHPQTGQIFYWEHFGMMDSPAYSQKAFSRLQLYTSNKIYPSMQLITTYETKE